jgi:hypothetical protein
MLPRPDGAAHTQVPGVETVPVAVITCRTEIAVVTMSLSKAARPGSASISARSSRSLKRTKNPHGKFDLHSSDRSEFVDHPA